MVKSMRSSGSRMTFGKGKHLYCSLALRLEYESHLDYRELAAMSGRGPILFLEHQRETRVHT